MGFADTQKGLGSWFNWELLEGGWEWLGVAEAVMELNNGKSHLCNEVGHLPLVFLSEPSLWMIALPGPTSPSLSP
jgi:hypothetical protein